MEADTPTNPGCPSQVHGLMRGRDVARIGYHRLRNGNVQRFDINDPVLTLAGLVMVMLQVIRIVLVHQRLEIKPNIC